MLPLPVAGGALLGAGLLFRMRFLRRVVGFAGIAILGWWFWQSYGWAYPVKAKWKAATWNIGRPAHPFAPLVAFVRAERPDVMILIESGAIGPAAAEFYERELPGYRVTVEAEGITCLTRGKVLQSGVRTLVPGSDVASFRVRVGDELWNVFGADLAAFPFKPREPQIRLLAAAARGRRRTLVMGDFNTPLESTQLESMRENFLEAREGPHRGFRETWFYNLPLLSLDQIWCSRDFRPRFASRRLTFASNHAPLVFSFGPAD
jgi:hypothetical protein